MGSFYEISTAIIEFDFSLWAIAQHPPSQNSLHLLVTVKLILLDVFCTGRFVQCLFIPQPHSVSFENLRSDLVIFTWLYETKTNHFAILSLYNRHVVTTTSQKWLVASIPTTKRKKRRKENICGKSNGIRWYRLPICSVYFELFFIEPWISPGCLYEFNEVYMHREKSQYLLYYGNIWNTLFQAQK